MKFSVELSKIISTLLNLHFAFVTIKQVSYKIYGKHTMRTDGHLYRSLFGYNFYDIGWISISMFTMINGYQPASYWATISNHPR